MKIEDIFYLCVTPDGTPVYQSRFDGSYVVEAVTATHMGTRKIIRRTNFDYREVNSHLLPQEAPMQVDDCFAPLTTARSQKSPWKLSLRFRKIPRYNPIKKEEKDHDDRNYNGALKTKPVV